MYDNIIDVAVICHLSSVIYDYLISYSHFIGILIIVEYTMVRILDSFFRDHRDERTEWTIPVLLILVLRTYERTMVIVFFHNDQ
jgi:hypothetical protein